MERIYVGRVQDVFLNHVGGSVVLGADVWRDYHSLYFVLVGRLLGVLVLFCVFPGISRDNTSWGEYFG